MPLQFREPSRLRDTHRWDSVLFLSLKAVSCGLFFLLGGLFVYLFSQAWPSLSHFGLSFLISTEWNPVQDRFGAAPVLYGTLLSSGIAMTLAAPLSVGVALFVTEWTPRRLGTQIGFLVEMLAAVPSIVYGLWGLFVLVPWMKAYGHPFLEACFGFLPFFQGGHHGIGLLTSGLVLAIMITPTIFSMTREIFLSIPKAQKEAALALGATRWEALWISVVQPSKSGIQGALILGLSRALGETMAVTMLIGNQPQLALSWFEPAQTMASIIANEYPEASSPLHLAALVEIALVLFAVTVLVNTLTRLFFVKRTVR